MFSQSNPEATIVCLREESQYTDETLDQAVNKVDETLVKLVFDWPCTPTTSCEHKQKTDTSDDAENSDQSHWQQREMLGRMILNDYMLRWYAVQYEKSSTDIASGVGPAGKFYKLLDKSSGVPWVIDVSPSSTKSSHTDEAACKFYIHYF